MRVCACMCDCVWVGLCGCPRALFKIALHHFTPIPFTMISPTTPKKKSYQREHRTEMDLAGFDNECTEIHRLSSLVAPQLHSCSRYM